jgi:hypothetical protein
LLLLMVVLLPPTLNLLNVWASTLFHRLLQLLLLLLVLAIKHLLSSLTSMRVRRIQHPPLPHCLSSLMLLLQLAVA